MLANYGLLAFTGIGVALMSVHIFILGALICLAAVVGIFWLYYSELLRVRLRLVNRIGDYEVPSAELWLALLVAVVATIAPTSIYIYSTAPERIQSDIRHLTTDQKDRMRPILRLDPTETYSLQVNSMPNCDECEQFAEEVRAFLNTIPGWKAGGSGLIFAQPPRRGLWLVANEAEQHLRPVDKLFKAFEDAGVPLRRSNEGVAPGTFVILIARQGVQ
jgi:hypothetical protein